MVDPLGDTGEGLGSNSAGSVLGAPASLDEACRLQHLEMPRDRRKTDVERGRQIEHIGLTFKGEADDDGAANRVGEGREGDIEICI